MTTPLNENAALYFVDRHVKEGRAEKVAFQEVDGKRRSLSYGNLAGQTDRFAGALLRQGIRREERMAMVVLDQLEFPIGFWGALKAGVVPVPMNTLLSSEVYVSMLIDSRAAMLLVSVELWDVVRHAALSSPFLRTIIVVGGCPEKATSYQDFIGGAPLCDAVLACGDEIAFWLYSSGSTGAPKGVRHVHSALQATADTFGAQIVGIGENDVVFSAAKLFFAYGLGNALSFPLSVGASALLLAGRPTADMVCDILSSGKPTVFCAVPTLFASLVFEREKLGHAPVHNIRISTSAGEALPKDIGERWQKIWKTEIVDGVGSTEMLHIFLSNRPGEVVYGTAGVAVPGYSVRLVDENDDDVEDGAVGELLVKGPSSADGYWNRREKSKATFSGVWTRTGDKYERFADGRFVFCGRSDDMFKVSGIWLSPFEVEQALVSHPAVLEAAVVPHRDEHGLEKPAAFVVLKDAFSVVPKSELTEHVKQKIGLWKYPRWIEFVKTLPKTATGKVQRFKLRQAREEGNV